MIVIGEGEKSGRPREPPIITGSIALHREAQYLISLQYPQLTFTIA